MDIWISGVGGQGTILASKILSYSAVVEGNKARTGETIGMSQRGGCVISHVRTGEVNSPYIPIGGADLLLSFELCEGARNIQYIKDDGIAIINTTKIMPVTTSLGTSKYDEVNMKKYIMDNSRAVFVDANSLAYEAGSIKAVNTVLIGVAYGIGVLDVTKESIIKSMEKNIKHKFLDLNLRAFKAGVKYGSEVNVKC